MKKKKILQHINSELAVQNKQLRNEIEYLREVNGDYLTEIHIMEARLKGEVHPKDNGILMEGEVLPSGLVKEIAGLRVTLALNQHDMQDLRMDYDLYQRARAVDIESYEDDINKLKSEAEEKSVHILRLQHELNELRKATVDFLQKG